MCKVDKLAQKKKDGVCGLEENLLNSIGDRGRGQERGEHVMAADPIYSQKAFNFLPWHGLLRVHHYLPCANEPPGRWLSWRVKEIAVFIPAALIDRVVYSTTVASRNHAKTEAFLFSSVILRGVQMPAYSAFKVAKQTNPIKT